MMKKLLLMMGGVLAVSVASVFAGTPPSPRVVVDHVFVDLAGRPNSRRTAHFSGHPAEIPALTLHRLGLMDGFADGTFRPDEPVTGAAWSALLARAFAGRTLPVAVQEADELTVERIVADLVTALGFAEEAQAQGGYPTGFLKVGNQRYLSRGLNVHVGERATRARVAQLLFYALGCEVRGTGKSLYALHAEKMGAPLAAKDVETLLVDSYYSREAALEALMQAGVTPFRIFASLRNVFVASPRKEERVRAARFLSEFLVPDTNEYNAKRYDKAYMELVVGRLNVLAAADFARAANDPREDEDVRLYALRALYLLDRVDLARKASWTVAFKSKAMRVTRHLCNKAQDILEMTDDAASTEALVAALSDSDVEVVLRAVDTLGRKGRNPRLRAKAAVSVPALQKLLDASHPYLPYRAYLAIQDLGGTPCRTVAPALQPYGASVQEVRTIVDGVDVHEAIPADYKQVVVNNGNIEVTFDARDTRSFAGMKKLRTCDNDQNLLKGYGFLTWNQESPLTGNKIMEHDGRRSQGLKSVSREFVEYAYRFDPSEKFPYSLELVYRIPRGASGLYLYAVVDKDEHSAASQHLYAGVMFRVNAKDWTFASGHDKFQYAIDWVKDAGGMADPHARKDIYQSAYRQPSGEVDAKHEVYLFNLENHILGMANDRVGLWQLFISNESYAKLLKHDMGAITDTMSTMYEGEYFTWTQRPIPAGKYHKFYGPMMLYVNRGDALLDKWEDAKNMLAREQARWPYGWVEDPHYFDRGGLRGRVEMGDGSSPEGAYVVVNIPGETKGKKNERFRTWNQNNGRYQYWTRAAADGTWYLDHVMCDTYSVTVWKEGLPGEVEKPAVAVLKDRTTDVGTIRFTAASNGTLAWRVGEADRTWLYDAEKRFNWETFMKYRNRFPNGVVFKVGESDPVYDWNYAQPSSVMGEERLNAWTILFDVNGAVPGAPVLTIATCGSRNCTFEVLVNEARVATLDYRDDDSMVIRTHAYGKHIVNTIPFDRGLLRPGRNEIKLVPTNKTDLIGHLAYDYIQLEYRTEER